MIPSHYKNSQNCKMMLEISVLLISFQNLFHFVQWNGIFRYRLILAYHYKVFRVPKKNIYIYLFIYLKKIFNKVGLKNILL